MPRVNTRDNTAPHYIRQTHFIHRLNGDYTMNKAAAVITSELP